MGASFHLVSPATPAPLDPGFRPPVLANRAFVAEAKAAGGVPLVLGLERPDGALSRFETVVFPEGHPRFTANLPYVERLFKFLLWQRGGCRTYVGGPAALADHLRAVYAPGGARAFDCQFMGGDVYGQPFEVLACTPAEVPPARELGQPLGRHLEGCRIGFDLGASDRKVSAVIDGEAVFSEEVVWSPRLHADPAYHYGEIMQALRTAASHLPRVDAIGGSTAGIVVNNQVRIASLFRGIPKDRYGEIRDVFLRIRAELGVPLEVANDGDVTALAGAMGLGENGVLGIALGSSEAAGYVNTEGNLLGWLNELAFAPVDYSPEAPLDEWSGDRGAGALYFSQQCVFRLAPAAGIELPVGVPDAERLKAVQDLLEAGHPGAQQIWETMGVYLGYAIAHYADFYEIRHLLLLGRCTSGRGGGLLLGVARDILRREFPELAHLQIQLPDERSRRVGQSIAAASLPPLP
jgi:predicted NBD/HSP70 family sugar kinase